MLNLGFDVLFKGDNFWRLLQGLLVVFHVSLVSLLLGFILAFPFALLLMSRNKMINGLSQGYLAFIRLMPQLVLLFVVFFGSTRVFHWQLSAEQASIIVFTMWTLAEMGDLMRAALANINKHQYESAAALGFYGWSLYRNIIIPQAIKQVIPPTINLITRIIKTTSLLLMIGVVEILKVGQQIIEANRMTSPNAAFTVYGLIFIFYFLACWPFNLLAKYLEKRWEVSL